MKANAWVQREALFFLIWKDTGQPLSRGHLQNLLNDSLSLLCYICAGSIAPYPGLWAPCEEAALCHLKSPWEAKSVGTTAQCIVEMSEHLGKQAPLSLPLSACMICGELALAAELKSLHRFSNVQMLLQPPGRGL